MIQAVDVLLLPVELRVGLPIHGHTIKRERYIPVVCITSAGIEGYGEAPPLPTFTGYEAHETYETLHSIVPILLGKTPKDALRSLHYESIADTQALAAVDIALHDLIAKQSGYPLYRLLGQQTPKDVQLSRAIGLHSLSRTVELAIEYQHHGLKALKLKVGRGLDADAEVIHGVREAVGNDLEISIDANGAFETEEACQLWQRTHSAHLAYFEQPVASHDIAGLQVLYQRGVCVLADESVSTVSDVKHLARLNAVSGIVIKLIKCGGLQPATEMVEEALKHGFEVTVVNPLGSTISLYADLHFASQLSASLFAHGLSAGYEVVAPYAPHPLNRGGYLRVSDAPGLGTNFFPPAERAAKSYSTRRE